MLLCIPCSSNSCEPNTQVGRNPVFLNSLFLRAFLPYSCLFPIPALLESSNSNKPLHNYFCYRYVSKKTLCGLSCSCGVVFHPSSAAPTTEGSPQQGSALQNVFRRLRSSSPPLAAMKTALPSSTEHMTSRTTRVRKRGRTLSCLLTLCIA